MKRLLSPFIFLILPLASFAQDSLLQRGIELYSKGEYRQAVDLLSGAAKQAEEKKDSFALQTIYTNLANSYSILGKAESALHHYQIAENLAINLKDSLRLAKIIKNIGALYNDQKDFNLAVEYFERAEVLASKLNAEDILADCKMNKAIAYEQLGDYDTAILLYQEALKTYVALGMEERMALTYNNLGIVHKLQNNLESSLLYYKKTLELAIKLEDQYIQAATYTNLANVYKLLKNFPLAIEMNQKALELAKIIDAPTILSNVYGNLSEVYAEQGNYKKAFDLARRYKQTSDSLINIERSSQLAEMREKYESEKKETENNTLRQEAEIRDLAIQEQNLQLEKRNLLLSASAVLILLISATTFFYFRWQKIKNEKAREEAIRKTEEEQRNRFARDLHDDLGAGLTRINFLSSMASRKTDDPDIQKDINSLSSTAKELIGNMREMIWTLDSKNITFDYLVARIREYSLSYLEDNNIEVVFDVPHPVPSLQISAEANRNLFLIFKEILQNILKHARATKVFIHIKPSADSLNITIKDNGIGFSENLIKGHGMDNMVTRAESLNGTIKIHSEKGEGCLTEIFFEWKDLFPTAKKELK